MKHWLLTIALICFVSTAKAVPYFDFIDPVHPQVSAGTIFDTHGGPVIAFTNVAIIYHPLSAGSLIPLYWQTIIPPESWTLLNVGAGGSGGNWVGAFGSSVNLVTPIQTWLYEGLYALGKAPSWLMPGAASFGISAGPEWSANVIVNGTVEPFNKWNLAPRWYAGAAYKF